MFIRIQNQIFNSQYVRYIVKVDNDDAKFYIGVFTAINDKEFYFEYPSHQKRNEDWERIDRELGSAFLYNKELTKS
ncbi:MAG: hypothetical protein SGI89_07465 [bacterium]|nr:hypothetical protein [bacterium]